MSIEELKAENDLLKADLRNCYTAIRVKEEEKDRLKAEVERLEHQVNYWRIEAETDNARWLRCLEDKERLTKAGDAMAEELIGRYFGKRLINEWNAAKEGKQS